MNVLGPDGRPARPSGEKAISFSELLVLEANAARTPRNSRRLARESYASVPYTFRAINLVTTALSAVPIKLFRGDEEIDTHPLLDALERPNARMGGNRLRETLVAYKKLAGTAFLVQLRRGGTGEPIPGAMYALRPDRCTIVADDSDMSSIEAVIYRPDEGEPQTFSPDEILVLRGWNPLDDLYGLSEVLPSAGSVDQLNESTTWNTNLLRNGGKPSAAVIAKHGLDPMARVQLEEWVARQYGGATNAGRIAVLEGTEIEWKELGMSARDLDYISGREMSAVEVALSHGVAPELLGVGQKTYNNYQEARKALYVETVRPELEYLLSEVNAWWVPMWGDPELYLAAQYGVIEELAADAQAEFERISEAFESGWLSVNDARRLAEMEEVPPELDLFAFQQRAQSTSPGIAPTETASSSVSTRERKEPLDPERARREYAPAINAYRETLTAEVAAIASRMFDRQREAVEAVLRDSGGIFTAATASAVSEALSRDERFESSMRSTFVGAVESLARVADDRTKADEGDLGPLFSLLVRDRGATRVDVEAVLGAAEDFALETLSRDLARIQGTTQGNVLRAIRRSLERGDSLVEIASGLDEIFETQAGRVPAIARTEAVSISNGAIDTLARALGTAPTRMWVSQDDARVRPAHVEADGQTVDLLGDFTVGGAKARFPGDPLLPPGLRINCRCFVLHTDASDL